MSIDFPNIESRQNYNLEKFYQKGEFEIQIVDHCNLNCFGCNHLSNIAEPWFMSKEEFEYSVTTLNKKVGHLIKRFMILGGEPFLHPELFDLIQIAYNTFNSNIQIDILTNGIIFDSNIKKYYEKIKNYNNVNFLITPYPLEYQNIFKEENQNKYKYNFMSSRLMYRHPKIDDNGQQNKNNYYNCCAHVLPCFIIRDKKLFICPFSSTIHNYNKKYNLNIEYQQGDYIDLIDLSEENLINFLKYGPTHICQHCLNDVDGVTYWSQIIPEKIDFIENKKDLFLNNYKKYEELYLGNNLANLFFNNKNLFFKNHLDPVYYSNGFGKKEFKRRFESLVDIIIPFYKTNKQELLELKENLESQTFFNQMVIYFISDTSENEELVYDIFIDFDNVVFLKTPIRSGPGVARQIGLNNSFGKSVFLLDIDDKIYSNNSIENLYNNLKENDFICGKIIENEYCIDNNITQLIKSQILNPGDMFHGYLINRSFLNNNNIQFNDALIGEDKLFSANIIASSKNNTILDDIVYIYEKGKSTGSLGHITTDFDKTLWMIKATLEAFLVYQKTNFNQKSLNYIESDIINLLNNFSDQKKCFIFNLYFFYYIYNKYKLNNLSLNWKYIISNLNIYGQLILYKVINNNFFIEYNDNLYFKNISDYKNKIDDYLNSYQNKNLSKFLKEMYL